MPQVSVLMPVYNGEAFLGQAIESILQQTFDDFEFIVINDGSTDRSAEVVQLYDDPRIRYFENECNIGLTRSLNRGLSLVRSPYLARMDADDTSLPQRLAKQVHFLDMHHEIGVVGSAVQIIDEHGNISRKWEPPETHEVLRWCLCLFTPIAHPTVMMRQEVVKQVGDYCTEMLTAQDHDLWRRLSLVTRLANLPDVLLHLRQHRSNITKVRSVEHRQNRVRAFHTMMSEFLGEDVPVDVVRCVCGQNCGSARKVHQAASLVYELYQVGMNNSALSLAEKRFIRNYVSERLLGLAYRRKDDGHGRRTLDVIALACYVNPLIVVKIVKDLLRRLACQEEDV